MGWRRTGGMPYVTALFLIEGIVAIFFALALAAWRGYLRVLPVSLRRPSRGIACPRLTLTGSIRNGMSARP